MAYKDLLVHVDSSSHCAARLALAVTLARRFGAHLTGLHVMPTLALSPFIADQYPTTMLDEAHARIAQLRDDARASFAAASQPLGNEAEWREMRGDTVDAVRLAARSADLAILGQPDPHGDGADAVDLPAQVVMGSGRPALIVPYAGTFADVGRRVMVAWNGSAQAARAVNDALPFLQGAERVVIVTVSPARRRHRNPRHRKRSRRQCRRHLVVTGNRRVRRPDRHGRLRPLSPARAGARRRLARIARPYDRAGVDGALRAMRKPGSVAPAANLS